MGILEWHLIEPMDTEKPMVAVREGGYLKSMIDEETGLLVEANIESIVRPISCLERSWEI